MSVIDIYFSLDNVICLKRAYICCVCLMIVDANAFFVLNISREIGPMKTSFFSYENQLSIKYIYF